MLSSRFDSETPVILVESATEDFAANLISPLAPSVANKVLQTRWHEYTNESIDSALLALETLDTSFSDHPLHDILRTLSSAVHKLFAARAELEESRRALLEKETSRRARADQLMRELQPSDRDLARRVIQSIFPDDDEDEHEVRRKASTSVSIMPLGNNLSLMFPV
jgi:small G protein signaling modulator 3